MTDPLAGAKRHVETVVKRHGVERSAERCPVCGGERWWTVKLPDGSTRRFDCPCFMSEMASWTTIGVDPATGAKHSETTTTCTLVCRKCGTRDAVEQAVFDVGDYICHRCVV